MELLSTEFHFILIHGNDSLWINRQTCQFTCKKDVRVETTGAHCLGIVFGFIGKIQFGENTEPKLIFIQKRSLVGKLRGSDIFKITSVLAVPLVSDGELLMEPCPKHHLKNSKEKNPSHFINPISVHGSVSDVGPRGLIRVKPIMFSQPSQHNVQNSPKKHERINKVEKRLLDEFYKMFTEADSFYYSPTYDLTNSVQRLALSSEKFNNKEGKCIWYGADSRFFWNYYMMSDLIQANDRKLDFWILSIMQGFVQCEHVRLNHLFDPVGPGVIDIQGEIDLWLISRRSRYRAGTRCVRGIDERGNVANFIETEQIMVYKKHTTSFILTRGSVPIFWSQPGFRYRPVPRLERGQEDNYAAFRQHIEEQISTYGPLVIITLLDKSGKETILGDAFLTNVLLHNSPQLSYFTFDFHENCRGMHFENVVQLIDKLDDSLKAISYCWVDSYGIVQTQGGVCRINCVDCLDRTNVVQTFIAVHALTAQMSKLGLVSPEFGIPDTLKRTLQLMWANNGDTISKQYAGTSALKGDYNRTGERRRFTGALKDGMNSANRYYLNRFRQANRQAVIDIILGIKTNIAEDELDNEKLVEERENTAEQLKLVIEDTKKCVIPKTDIILGAWGLVNARDNDPIVIDVDAIFILTEKYYCITGYDCSMDSITDTEKVNLSTISSIELGYEVLSQSLGFLGLFASGNQPSRVPTVRINFINAGISQFHQFRSSNMRFFNNLCVPIHQPEEMLDALKLFAETLQISAIAQGNPLNLTQAGLLIPTTGISKSSPSGSSSWAHRYFNFGPVNERPADSNNDMSRKSLSKSFVRFTPKYFRRSSAADSVAEVISAGCGANVTHIEILKESGGRSEKEKTSGSVIDEFNSFSSKATLLTCDISQMESRDLVLPSCGLISVPSITLQRPDFQFPALISNYPKCTSGFDIVTKTTSDSPISGVGSPEHDTNIQLFEDHEIMSRITPNLKQHRYSLPTHSLVAGDGPSFTFITQSPLTPEITITGEYFSESGTVAQSGLVLPLRLSKSSEDVVKLINRPSSISTIGRSELKPICSESTRSTSDQDISVSCLMNSLKSSHSENSIKENNSFQRTSQQAGNTCSSQTLKKELVLAPLGKLARGMQSLGANYLHPKKLKDTFKPQLRQNVDVVKQEDLEELRILEEKKRNCKSLIIDI